jgi:hypothetical protein
VRADIAYSPQQIEKEFAAVKSAFSLKPFSRSAAAGNPDPTPIFVVGMPRSGTTLVEQILCSHPDIAGANEFGSLPYLLSGLIDRSDSRSIADALDMVTDAQLRALADAYLHDLRSYSGTARYIVDKLPGNFMLLGLIELILPEAKIVHCRRDALDTCFSIYKTRFVRGSIEYGYDMADLGHYYRQYKDLMRFWDDILPKRPIDLGYEDLVADMRSESERLLGELGIEWSDSCLRFYETARSVQTASVTQVRRPIYTSSIGKAEKFGAALDPLRRALAGE